MEVNKHNSTPHLSVSQTPPQASNESVTASQSTPLPNNLAKKDTLDWLSKTDEKLSGTSLDLSSPDFKQNKPDRFKGFAAGFLSGGLVSGTIFGVVGAQAVTEKAAGYGVAAAKVVAKRYALATGLIALGSALAGGVAGAVTSQQSEFTTVRSGAKSGAVVGALAGGVMFALKTKSEPFGGILLIGAMSGWAGGAAGARVAKGQGVLEASVKALVPWMN